MVRGVIIACYCRRLLSQAIITPPPPGKNVGGVIIACYTGPSVFFAPCYCAHSTVAYRVWRTVHTPREWIAKEHELQKSVKLCKNRIIILQSSRYFSIILFKIRRCCLFLHTTCECNDKIMKIAPGHLSKKFHTKKLSMNTLIMNREKQSLKLTL
jgi:hypothetical protein